jgi:hypothetical protein
VENDMKILVGIVLALWAIFWSSVLAVDASAFERIGGLALGWGPLAVIVWFYVHRAGSRGKARSQMLAELDIPADQGWDHAEDGTAIAINQATKSVGLLAGGRFKIYGYDQIRSWEAREERAGGVVGVGVAAGVAAAGANVRMAREAEANTGLFVEVKDVDAPRWRIAMKREGARSRWMEILRQEIKEGGAAALK